MIALTYGELGQRLLRVGFTTRDNVERKTRIYEHASGAEIYLPLHPDDLAVYPWHLVGVRFTLDQFGLPDPFRSDVDSKTAW